MSNVSDRTDELLEGLAWGTQEQAYRLVSAARAAGIPLVLISGLRSPEGNMDVGGAARSLHLQGRAFDVAVWGYRRDQVPLWWWTALGTWAELQLELFWGGRFLQSGAPDVNHFDSRRLTHI